LHADNQQSKMGLAVLYWSGKSVRRLKYRAS